MHPIPMSCAGRNGESSRLWVCSDLLWLSERVRPYPCSSARSNCSPNGIMRVLDSVSLAGMTSGRLPSHSTDEGGMDPRGIPRVSQCAVGHTVKAQFEDLDRSREAYLLFTKKVDVETTAPNPQGTRHTKSVIGSEAETPLQAPDLAAAACRACSCNPNGLMLWPPMGAGQWLAGNDGLYGTSEQNRSIGLQPVWLPGVKINSANTQCPCDRLRRRVLKGGKPMSCATRQSRSGRHRLSRDGRAL
jgi:hypothetical protein